MLIKILVEDHSESEEYGCEHGLSLYVEDGDYKLLFDVGASGLFHKNAKKMGIKTSEIDSLVISRGHDDHGGGLKVFLSENRSAGIYLHRHAFGKFYILRSNNNIDYIGIDDKLKDNQQLIYTSDRFFVNDKVQLFSNVPEIEPKPILNSALLVEKEGDLVSDTFEHEQYLVIDSGDKVVLMTGCAHNGIINVIEHFKKLRGRVPDYIIGGFHFSNKSQTNTESESMVEKIGTYHVSTGGKFYTCHCTGQEPFDRLKAIMGDQIEYITVGTTIEI